jgi:coenzyme PQQ synthesis protein D (PqqD)
VKGRQSKPSIEQLQLSLASGRFALQLDDAVLASFQADAAVLLDYHDGEYYGLNAVAASVWKFLSAGHSFAEIVGEVTELYDVSLSAAREDVTQLVADLLELGIVHLKETQR